METNSFSFELPRHLIAQKPTDRRDDARLMVSDAGSVSHRNIRDLVEVIPADALLVINDSRVRKARIYASQAAGDSAIPSGRTESRQVEILFLAPADAAGHPVPGGPVSRAEPESDSVAGGSGAPARWAVIARRPGRNPEGRRYLLPGGVEAKLSRWGEHFLLTADTPLDEAWFEEHGHVPLPPYIERSDVADDSERYQTVFAERPGSAAAPTAGLHLTRELLERLEAKGVEIARITLHVGAGTFAPVRTERVEDHVMHSERFEVSEEAADAVTRAKKEGRPVVAVGTTSVRTLETAWDGETLKAGSGESRLFIFPGYRFGVVDELLTNFHTPKSSLLMLVSAFAGVEHIRHMYRIAVEREYRFFSYGDAMYLRVR